MVQRLRNAFPLEVRVHREPFTCYAGLCYLSIKTWNQGLAPPGSSVHGILQARRPECRAIPFSRQSLHPGRLHCRQILRHLSHEGSQAALSSMWTARQKARSGPSVLLTWQTFSNYPLNGQMHLDLLLIHQQHHILSQYRWRQRLGNAFPLQARVHREPFACHAGFMIPVREDLGSREGYQMAGRQKNPGLPGM